MSSQINYLGAKPSKFSQSEVKKIMQYFWKGKYEGIENIVEKHQRIAVAIDNNGGDNKSMENALYVIEKGQSALKDLGV